LSKINIAVVFGGRSVEHEISLKSAKSIIENIDSTKYEILPIFIEKSGIWRKASLNGWLNGDDLDIEPGTFICPSLNPQIHVFYEMAEGKISAVHPVDVIFPVLHGTYGEDGTVQGMFELMGVPFVGSSILGSAAGMDKIVMKAVLKEFGLPVVPYVSFYKHEWESDKSGIKELILEQVKLPCFVKSADLGSSVGISKVNSVDKLNEAVDSSCKFSNRILVEDAVSNPREIEVSVLGNEDPIASVPGEIVPHREFYDYTAKYLEEGTGLFIPANLDEDVSNTLKEYAVKTFTLLDCSGLGRVDFLMNGETNEIFISEINTMPGFTDISMYPKLFEHTGISYPELVSRLIDLAFDRSEKENALSTDLSEAQ